MSNPSSSENSAQTSPSFEEALARVEKIVGKLEDGQQGLAESLELYEEGVRLFKQCYALLDRAERRIELLTGVDSQQQPVTEPFDDDDGASLEEKAESRSRRRTHQGKSRSPARRGRPDDLGPAVDDSEPVS